MTDIGHGRRLRGLDVVARSSVDAGRFGRLLRALRPAEHTEDALRELARTMAAGDGDTSITGEESDDENPTIPAGFTYLGQFVDHDITFDPVSSLTAIDDPDALRDFRTPRLDLDSVYGRGNADQPYLYRRDDDFKLVVGPDRRPASVSAPRPDLPRNADGRALIGDPRNDENLIVSQLQSLFARFHNKVADVVRGGTGPTATFEEVQRVVRWHYQWIVVHDFLPRVVGQDAVDAILPWKGAAPKLELYRPKREAFLPVEFHVAADRYRHSMVRPSYSLSADVLTGADSGAQRIPICSDNPDAGADLNGFRPLPDGWGVDWAFFFRESPAAARREPDATPCQARRDSQFHIPQPSFRIDTVLVDPPIRGLAERILQRGRALALPSGQAVARFLGIEPIPDDKLWLHHDPARTRARQAVLSAFPQFAGNAPLWFYVLREAEDTHRSGTEDATGLGGHHLGRLGGRIVAEVLIGLLWHDHHSYLYQDPLWQPRAPIAPRDGEFTMSDLVAFTDA